MVPLLIASIWAWPESKPTTTMPFFPLSSTPLTTPMAEPSFEPKMPAMSGLAAMIDLVMSADLAWSPPPYWGSSTVMPGALAFIQSMKPSRRSLPDPLVWSCTTRATVPLPPSRSDMCLAASAAAALLSVEAVVTGMSLSTPESNAITGMLAALACSSSGAAAWESSAAKPSAAGFLARAWVSSSIWISTSASVGGPSKEICTPSLSASDSAPDLTACQNWCWKPLETMATSGFGSTAIELAGISAAADEAAVPSPDPVASDDAAPVSADDAAVVAAAEVGGAAAEVVVAESLALEQALSTSPRTATAERAAIRYLRRCMVGLTPVGRAGCAAGGGTGWVRSNSAGLRTPDGPGPHIRCVHALRFRAMSAQTAA